MAIKYNHNDDTVWYIRYGRERKTCSAACV